MSVIHEAIEDIADAEDSVDIVRTEGVCGGSACVGDTRSTVWMLVQARQLGVTDQQLLADYPTLTPAHLQAAWTYHEAHQEEIEREIAEQNE